MYRIGIIYGLNSMEWIQQLEDEFYQYELIFIPFEHYNELESLYMEYKPFLDGIIFSGPTPYLVLKNKFTSFDMPTEYFVIEERNFYKKVTSILINDKNFSFKRTLFDFLSEENNFMGLSEILTPDEFPHIFQRSLEDMALEDLYEQMIAHIKHLMDEDEIDLTITGSSNVAKLLELEGIKHIAIHPSVETMLKQLDILVQEIQMIQLQEKQIAVGKIKHVEKTIESGLDDNNFNHILLYKALLEFNQQYNNPLLINQNHVGFDVLITIQNLRKLTNNFNSCQLSTYLKEVLPFDVKISWGVDSELENARGFAVDGIKILSQKTNNEDTILNYFGKRIVLEQKSSISGIPNLHKNKIYQISDYLEIQPEQLKIILAIKQSRITAKIVAEKLNMTTRSANRLLNKLVKKNGAIQINNEHNTRGRPERQFQLTIANLFNEIE